MIYYCQPLTPSFLNKKFAVPSNTKWITTKPSNLLKTRMESRCPTNIIQKHSWRRQNFAANQQQNFQSCVQLQRCGLPSLPRSSLIYIYIILSKSPVYWASPPYIEQVPRILSKSPVYWASSPYIEQFPRILTKLPVYWASPPYIEQVLRILSKSPVYWASPPYIEQLPRIMSKSPVYWASSPYNEQVPRILSNFPV